MILTDTFKQHFKLCCMHYGKYKQNKKDWFGGNWKCNSFYWTQKFSRTNSKLQKRVQNSEDMANDYWQSLFIFGKASILYWTPQLSPSRYWAFSEHGVWQLQTWSQIKKSNLIKLSGSTTSLLVTELNVQAFNDIRPKVPKWCICVLLKTEKLLLFWNMWRANGK